MISRRPARSGASRLLACLALLGPLSARAGEEPLDYIRFVADGKDAGRLETAIVTLSGKDGLQVHLVAAVHVGDAAYYRRLSRLFDSYQALLYEMIKPEGVEVRPGAPSRSLISGFQRGLKEMLDLEFQLDAIDYSRKNFVHADMDPETFERLSAERGESIFSLMLQSMLEDLKQQARGKGGQEISGFDLLAVLLSRDRARSMKLLLGKRFQDLESRLAGLGGEKGSVILTERNKVALGVLRKTIDSGKKEIGVFYGGAHMPDLERRICTELGLVRGKVEWVTAWDMPHRIPGTAPRVPEGEKRPPPAPSTPPVKGRQLRV